MVTSHRVLTLLLWPVPSANDQGARKTHTTLNLWMNPRARDCVIIRA